LLTIPLSINWVKKILHKEQIKYNSTDSDSVVTFGGAYGYWKESINKSWMTNLTSIKFEECELSCFKDYRDYLTYFYGDYMTPPPEHKRNSRHKIIKIEFEEEA
jgi:lipopolysaccharide cholinephosphotransferase